MQIPFLYQFPIWATGVVFFLVLLASMEGGFRFGQSQKGNGLDTDDAGGDISLTAMYALLGLILAFTYSFAVARADKRKQAVVDEANAIGTAFLRAELFGDAGGELRQALLAYGKTRIITYDLVSDPETTGTTLARTHEAATRIWPATHELIGVSDQGPLQASLVASVNEVLDADASRLAAAFDRLPSVVLFMLMIVGAATIALSGYNRGLSGDMNRTRMTAVAMVLATVVVIITDFDRGYVGLVLESQLPLENVVAEMELALDGSSRSNGTQAGS